jgi:hypothetical protein
VYYTCVQFFSSPPTYALALFIVARSPFFPLSFLDLSPYALSPPLCLGFVLGCTAAVIISVGTLEISTYVYFTSRVPCSFFLFFALQK